MRTVEAKSWSEESAANSVLERETVLARVAPVENCCVSLIFEESVAEGVSERETVFARVAIKGNGCVQSILAHTFFDVNASGSSFGEVATYEDHHCCDR